MKTRIHGFSGFVLCGLLLVTFLFCERASAQEIDWRKIERGILYARLETKGLLDQGKTATIHVYNIDTSRFAFRLFDCRDYSLGEALSFEEWYQETDSPVVLNVCPNTIKKETAGYFRIADKTIQGQPCGAWKGLLATGPHDHSRPFSRIIDMRFVPFDPRNPQFTDVFQQPMLLDENRELRVGRRVLKATRVALGEDDSRNALIFLTEDPCTLFQLAQWLKNGPFSLKRAISLGMGNAPQVLGRFAPQRIYILGEASKKAPVKTRGSFLQELSSTQKTPYIMGIVPASQERTSARLGP